MILYNQNDNILIYEGATPKGRRHKFKMYTNGWYAGGYSAASIVEGLNIFFDQLLKESEAGANDI